MKNGTEYGKRVRKLFSELSKGVEVQETEPTDPLEQFVVATLGAEAGLENGRIAYRILCDTMVDLNEVRVSSPMEIGDLIEKHIPEPRVRARVLINGLNALYLREDHLSLESLLSMGRREARAYLDSLSQIEPYVVSSVFLWSLGGHAIPVRPVLRDALADEDLIDSQADISEVQAFLDRNIPAAEGKLFCHVMDEWATNRSSKSEADGKEKTDSAKKKTKKAKKAKKTKKTKKS